MEPGAKDSDEDSSSNSATDSDSDYDAYGDGASTIHGTMSGLSLTNGSSGGGVALNSSTGKLFCPLGISLPSSILTHLQPQAPPALPQAPVQSP